MAWMGSGLGKKGDSLLSSGRSGELRSKRVSPRGKSETVPFFPARQKERGSVLIAAIFILIILAAIAVSATSSSVLESRMSVNSIDQNSAFQSAEAALRGGEAAIIAAPVRPAVTGGCNPTVGPANPCVATLNTVNGGVFANAPVLPWGTVQTAVVPGVTNAANPHAPLANPEVVVEFIGKIPDPGSGSAAPTGRDFYRVTSRGTGRNNAQAIVQSTYAKRN